MNKYRKKPVVVEAIQWKGNNFGDLMEYYKYPAKICANPLQDDQLRIKTPEGLMIAVIGDYIVKGESSQQGVHFRPVKEDYFIEHYEKVSEHE